MRTGILLALVGIWVIARSVTQDDTGRTLPDYILGKAAEGATAVSASAVAPPAGQNSGVVATVGAGVASGLSRRRRRGARRPPNTAGVGYTP